MNRYRLIKAGIDVNEGLNRFLQNTALYEKFLMNFPSDVNYGTLERAVNEGNPAVVFQAAHALKGVAGNLSLTRLYEALVPLVDEVRGGTMGNARALFVPVASAYAAIIEQLAPDPREDK